MEKAWTGPRLQGAALSRPISATKMGRSVTLCRKFRCGTWRSGENRSLTICEDDAVFNHSFYAYSQLVLREIPPDWHVIKWGWISNSMLWFDMILGVSSCMSWFNQKSLRKGINIFQSAVMQPRAFRHMQSFGNVCYSVSSTGARLLRQNCLPLRNTTVYVPGLRAAV